jgi:hypothetical protein
MPGSTPTSVPRVTPSAASGATFVFDHEGKPDLIGNELTGGVYRVMVGRAPVGEGRRCTSIRTPTRASTSAMGS